MWIAWSNPKPPNLGVERRGLVLKVSPPVTQKSGVVMVLDNEFQSQPYPTIRHWKGQADENGLNQSKLNQSWCYKWIQAE